MSLLETMTNAAKENLRNCAATGIAFQPVAILIKDNCLAPITTPIIALSWTDDEQKLKVFAKVGKIMAENDCHEVIIIIDALMRMIKSPEEAQYIMANWDTERPSTYPKSAQQDTLNIHYINFKKKDTFYVLPYTISSGKVTFLESHVEDETFMGGSIRNTIAIAFLRDIFLKLVENGTVSLKDIEDDKQTVQMSHDLILSKYPNVKGVKLNG
jgi:hypothetical protein